MYLPPESDFSFKNMVPQHVLISITTSFVNDKCNKCIVVVSMFLQNLKADSQLSSGTLLFTTMEIFGLRSPRTLFCEWTLRFEKQVHWRWHHYHAKVSSRQNFLDLRGKGFPTDSRHSNGHKLCPSPIQHISVLIRSGIHTVFAINWKEKVSILVQLHIQIHRWRIVNQ